MSETQLIPIREAHQFDEAALHEYIQAHIPQFGQQMDILQFEGGQSNPTFKLMTEHKHYVLRKQPPGDLLPSAHQVNREYEVMKALQDTAVPVPKMLFNCNDTSIIGSKFYVMEMVEGHLYNDVSMPSCDHAERTAIYKNLITVMAKLHQIDIEAVGLQAFGKQGNYFQRQYGRWSKQYHAAKTDELTTMDQLISWLAHNIPEDDTTTIVHGDYRLGNVLIAENQPQVVAVLDWELSTLGHPLSDLGYFCQDYYGCLFVDSKSLSQLDLRALGIPEQQQLMDWYCEASGRSGIDNWLFYVIFNLFRSASIAQGVYKRGVDGNASSQKAMLFKDGARRISQLACDLIEQV